MTTDENTYPTAAEMAELDAALDSLAEGGSYRPTLNGLIRGWRALVEQIERGYDWSIYEYFNDLHVRSMLQAVIDRAPAIRAWVQREVAPLDERFRAATRARGTHELLDRVPRFPGPELAGDLDDPGATTTLYRPVGDDELALIEQSNFTRFPQRLAEQPIFYPVLSEAYAERIAREWNAREGRPGHITRFAVRSSFLTRYPAHAVCVEPPSPFAWRRERALRHGAGDRLPTLRVVSTLMPGTL
jgi:hypothetical protein